MKIVEESVVEHVETMVEEEVQGQNVEPKVENEE